MRLAKYHPVICRIAQIGRIALVWMAIGLSAAPARADGVALGSSRGDLARVRGAVKQGLRSWIHQRISRRRIARTVRHVNWARGQLGPMGVEDSAAPVKVYSDHTRRAAIHGKLAARALRGAKSGLLRALGQALGRRAETIDSQRQPFFERHRRQGHVVHGSASVRELSITINGDQARTRRQVLPVYAHENQHALDHRELARLTSAWERLNERAGDTPTAAHYAEHQQLLKRWNAVAGTTDELYKLEDRAHATQARVMAKLGDGLAHSIVGGARRAGGYRMVTVNRELIKNYLQETRSILAGRLSRAASPQLKLAEAYFAGYRRYLVQLSVIAIRNRVDHDPAAPAALSPKMASVAAKTRWQQLMARGPRAQRRADRKGIKLVKSWAGAVRAPNDAFALGWLAASMNVGAGVGADRLLGS